ncbi:hypothetical protein [Micromonospora taraxaci]|uniref:hypothetical protein n=1 Tax=Micromonospora taraxaci TaxID=1316803 RepID=UPI0033A746EC
MSPALVDTVVARLQAMVDFMQTQAAAGNTAYAGHLAAGHHVQCLSDATYVIEQRAVFDQHLQQ